MDGIRYNVELLVKVSSRPGSELAGEATFIFSDETQHFSSIMELVGLIEERTCRDCPHLEHNFRSWTRAPSKAPRGRQIESERPEQNRQTFHLSIQFAENYTWQGKIQWLEGRKSLHFRSFLELIRLMDEAARTAASEVSASIGL